MAQPHAEESAGQLAHGGNCGQLGLCHVELFHHVGGTGSEDQVGKVQHGCAEDQNEENDPAHRTLLLHKLTLTFFYICLSLSIRTLPGGSGAQRNELPRSYPVYGMGLPL